MDGVLIVNKPAGWTSHDVVLKTRRILKEKKIGHTGTLDPLATGVLVLCVGKATRIARYLEAEEKEYRAVMELGVMTDTLDAEGRVLERRAYTAPSRTEIIDTLRKYHGVIMQRPPVYSAVKLSGIPAYKLARKGMTVELKERPVTVSRLELTSYENPLVGLQVSCSKGVYIRVLCSDIGSDLRTGARLVSLTRVRSGRFTLEQAMTLEQITALANGGTIDNVLISIDNALRDLPRIEIGVEEVQKLSHGTQVPWQKDFGEHFMVRVHDPYGHLVALARAGSGKLRPELVFL